MDNENNCLCNIQAFHSSFAARDVNYSCGSCGYELNLNSCNRYTSFDISTEYEKSIKKGTFSFYTIDESRFTQTEELRWIPYFSSIRSWGLCQQRTKLLCYKCGNHIGNAYKQNSNISSPLRTGKLQAIAWDGISDDRIYSIKIRALQPSSNKDFSTSE